MATLGDSMDFSQFYLDFDAILAARWAPRLDLHAIFATFLIFGRVVFLPVPFCFSKSFLALVVLLIGLSALVPVVFVVLVIFDVFQ